MKSTLIKVGVSSLMLASFGMALMAHAAAPNWNVSGTYVVALNYLGNDYAHDMSLTQDSFGSLTGNGGSPSGANVYTWTITSGTVSGDVVDFYANYTATADAVVPQTVMHMTGTVAVDGGMSGTWSDNYQGGTRTGTWTTTSGHALVLAGALAAEDFGVVNYDTGLGVIKGYSAGFGLTGATLASSTSVVVNLYGAGNQLLQTNTAILPKFNADITGTQFSTPFDVSGAFNYAVDGYWTNVRQAEYGQSVPATRVVATVTLANGKVVTAENTVVTGDPTTIFPPVATTTVAVHLFKYVDGVQAATSSVNSVNFPMFTSTYNAPFTLGPAGWTTGDIAYEASTGPMPLGSSYSANENTSTMLVGTTCTTGVTYSLVGYTTGNTLVAAQQVVATTSVPSFTNLRSDAYIIVWNHLCAVVAPVRTGSISGMKYNDLNKNGKHDANEPGLANWVIQLKNGTTTVSTTTDANGNYTFSNVAPGTYKVREVHQNGWKRMSVNPKAIVITAGSVVTDVTFGNAQKHWFEREDNNKDDDRDDQSGNYFAHSGRSDYGNDQHTQGHSQR
jgi:hypothetical protein